MENISSSEYILPDVPFIKLEPNDEAVSANNRFQSRQIMPVKSNEAPTASNKKINFMSGTCCNRRISESFSPGVQDPLNFHPLEVPFIKEEPKETFADIIIKAEPEDCVGLYDNPCTSNAFQDTTLIFPVKEEVVKEEPEREDFLAIVYDETKVIDIEAKPPVNNVRRSRKSLGVIRTEFKTKKKTSVLCSECGLDFKSVSSLKQHFANVHGKDLIAEKIKNEFIGNLLEPSLDFKALDDNASNDDTESEFFGDFPSKVELKRGSRRKDLGTIRIEEQFPSLCNECGKTFSREEYLQRHVREVHQKLSLPQHICDVCGKVCYGLTNLKAHVSTHTAIAKSCKICGKLTKYLATHMYSHRFSGDVKIKVTCHICGMEMNKRSLSNHIEKVHEKKPSGVFPCKLCADIFYRFEELRV